MISSRSLDDDGDDDDEHDNDDNDNVDDVTDICRHSHVKRYTLDNVRITHHPVNHRQTKNKTKNHTLRREGNKLVVVFA